MAEAPSSQGCDLLEKDLPRASRRLSALLGSNRRRKYRHPQSASSPDFILIFSCNPEESSLNSETAIILFLHFTWLRQARPFASLPSRSISGNPLGMLTWSRDPSRCQLCQPLGSRLLCVGDPVCTAASRRCCPSSLYLCSPHGHGLLSVSKHSQSRLKC